jgi:hypothetical protein
MGKLTNYVNVSSKEKIDGDFDNLLPIQTTNINLLIDVIDKSQHKNIAFIHSIDAFEERNKMYIIRDKMKNSL